jgi:hypothetical protein
MGVDPVPLLLLPEPPAEAAPELLPEPLVDAAPEDPLPPATPLDPPPPTWLPLPPAPVPAPLPFAATAPEPLAATGVVGFDEQFPSAKAPTTHEPTAKKKFGFMEFTRLGRLTRAYGLWQCIRDSGVRSPQEVYGHRHSLSHFGEMQSWNTFHKEPASGGKQLLAQSSARVPPSGRVEAASTSMLPPSGACPL